MKYAQLASRVFNTPLAIEQGKLETVMSVLGPRLEVNQSPMEDRAAMFGSSPCPDMCPVIVENVAIIPVHGTLVYRHDYVSAMSGLTSYQRLAGYIIDAAEDNRVDGILLDIDSPGGEVCGLFDLADMIEEVSKDKPIIAVSNEAAYSAAYAIASAADELYLSRTSGVGSIGVIAQHVSYEERNKKEGVKVTPVFAGDKKADLSPDFDLSKSAHADLKKHVDDIYNIFVETVAINRNLSQDVVRDTQAGLFYGQDAVDLGLADGVSTFDNVLEAFLLELSPAVRGENSQNGLNSEAGEMRLFSRLSKSAEETEAMNKKEIKAEAEEAPVETPAAETEAAAEEAPVETTPAEKEGEEVPTEETPAEEEGEKEAQAETAADAAKVVEMACAAGCPEKAAELIRTGASLEEVETTLNASQKIKDLCERAGMSSLSAGFIDKGLSASEVKDQLFDLMAARDEASDVSSKQDPEGAASSLEGSKNVLEADAERRRNEWEKRNS